MASKESIPYRPLGMVSSMLRSLGFEVTHCYEDLVFVEHNAFLVQMGDRGEDVTIWFNVDSIPEKRGEIMEGFKQQESLLGFNISNSGTYKLVTDKEKETLRIEFIS